MPNLNTTGSVPNYGDNGAGGATDQYKQDLKGKDDVTLKEMLKDPKLTADQRAAILDELAMRAKETEEAESPGGGGGDEIDELMKKLRNGTITEEEMEKLAGLLGVDVAELEKQKGKGGEAPKDDGAIHDH